MANILGYHENLPEVVAKELKEYQLYDVEIKYGLLQVTEAIQFLHNDVRLLHNNICPESIVVNKNGAWKLTGLDFCVPNKNPPEQTPFFPCKDWDPDIAPNAQSNLDYMAPEYALSESCSFASDMFSMGVLIYAMFNRGKPLYECNHQLSIFRKNVEELRKWRGSLLGNIPLELRDIVKLLFNTEPTVRPDADQLAKISFFDDVGSKTLQYMDTLFQQDNLPKSKFFKGLPKIIAKLPKRVNLQRILPPLLKECVNPDMIPFVLPNILQIAEQASEKDYTILILPELIPMFKITAPVQILLIFMQNMSLLLKKTPASDIKTHVLPMIYRALESDNSQIQELCLSIIPTFVDMIDYSAIKNSIVPRIKKLCLGTSSTGVRVNSILCLGKMLESMDKWYVMDEVLPLLPQIPSRESSVLMSILGIYKVALTHEKLGITKDMLAGKVIPFLMTVCTEHSLNLGQFAAFITLIREMVDKVEKDHRSKLEQLEQMRQEQKSMEITRVTEEDDKTLISGIEEKPESMIDTFLSGYMSENKKKSLDTSLEKCVAQAPATSQPIKVTLSLEEKQRIAKQQEQQRFLQASRPLCQGSLSAGTNNKFKQSSSQSKDLTNYLLQSNTMNLNLSSSKATSSISFYDSSGFNMHDTVSSSSLGNGTSQQAVASASYGTSVQYMNQDRHDITGGTVFSQTSSGPDSKSAQRNKPMDLSSFDSLLPSNTQKQKISLEQMGQMSGVTALASKSMVGGQNLGSGQTMIGNQGMMGKHGLMGPCSGGPGTLNSGFIGPGLNYGYSGGMNFQQGSISTGGQNILQPQTLRNKSTTNMPVKNDLDDLFG